MAGGVGQGQSRPRGQILDAALALPEMLEQSGFVDIRIGPSVDTFGAPAAEQGPVVRGLRLRVSGTQTEIGEGGRDLFQVARSVAHREPR